MLGYFPAGYPDEIFLNICARYQENVGKSSLFMAAKRLFGALGPIHPYWPIRLRTLVNQLPDEFGVSVDQLIEEHTLAPFLNPFLTSLQLAELREYMRGCDSTRTLRMIGRAREGWLTFKYCPLCAEEDRNQYGEAYWHRVHQPSIVEVCQDHSCYLEKFQNYKAVQGIAVPAEHDIPLKSSARFIEPGCPRAVLSLWLSRQVRYLLDNPKETITSANLSVAFTRRITDLRLLTTRGLPDFARIRDSFRSYLNSDAEIDDERLERYKINSDPVMHNAIRRQRGSPGLWLLLMNWLGIEARSLLKLSANLHFEDGPWPCLNKVCQFYGVDVIQNYSYPNTTLKKGIFTCHCGFSYSRLAPDRDGCNRTKLFKILQTGKIWEERFIASWSDRTITSSQIAATLGCSMTYVRKVSVALDLPSKINCKTRRIARRSTALTFEQRREAYRSDICELKRLFPNIDRGDFYARLKRQLQWLLKNDRKWLESAIPKGKHVEPKLDWEQRDLRLSRIVPRIRQQFIDDDIKGDRVRTMTKTRFFTELKIDYHSIRRGRYLRTIAAVANATESSNEFKIRKLFHLLQGDDAKLPRTFPLLLNKAWISIKMRESEAFKDILRSAEELFLSKVQPCFDEKAA